MKKIYFVFIYIISCFSVNSQINISSYPNKNYSTLKAAFDDINKGIFSGKIDLLISGSTSETAPIILNQNGGNFTYLNIICTAPSTISGSILNSLITFNGSKNVNINGHKMLSLVNNATKSNTLTLINDASDIAIIGCNIRGSNGNADGGVVYFGTGTNNGNSRIKIDSCDIDGMSAAMYCVHSSGSTVTSTMENHSDTISNCNVYNNHQTTANTAGIFLDYGSTGWVIKQNNIYQTQNINTGIKGIFYGILALPYLASDAHFITNNNVGGNGTSLSGGNLSVSATGTNAIGFMGMDIETAGPGNAILNNTIKNIVINYSSNDGFQNSGIFSYLSSFTGTSIIDGNTISNITMVNNSGLITIQGIACTVDASKPGLIVDTFNISNNTITNITGNSGGIGDVQLYGIRLNNNSPITPSTNSNFKVQYNVSGNSLSNFNAPFAGNFTYIRGISNLNNDVLSNGTIIPTYRILKNSLHDFFTSSKLGSITSASIEGIKLSGGGLISNGSSINTISGNIIHHFNCTQPGDFSTTATGIYTSNAAYSIEKNRIFSFINQANATTSNPTIIGIHARSSIQSSKISNNFICLGSEINNDVSIFGILNSSQSDSIAIYFNSVLVSGNSNQSHRLKTASLAKISLEGEKVNSPISIKNNILINSRGASDNYVLLSPEAEGLNSNHNDLYSTYPSTLAFYNNSKYDFASYKLFSKQDINSLNENVSFKDLSTGDLHLSLPSASLKSGITVDGIITDIDDKVRDGMTPFIGAEEYTGNFTANSSDLSTFRIFPNPGKDHVYIQISTQSATQGILAITNLISQKVIYKTLTIPNNGTAIPIDVNFLEKGIYFIQLDINGEINTKKFIKL